ncbi:uncharacterized protein LOC130994835 isoform X1 [Salvia miltiorrhiza]|uniref:uncharacterized protein LOC130994835 isoform X1 n=1 Tax=Salvia miltiorrhiza TaxID=226208 RepID=UPI0025AB7D8F|nr:uncharacterized protein LOC130994835 isoform X1 [Salvia miltiorrhiza]
MKCEEVRVFKCMHPLYFILDSQNGWASSHEMIAMIEDHRTSFDEECRKIQYEAEFATSSRANASDRSLKGLTREDAHILQQRNKDRTDPQLVVHPMAATKASPRACMCQSNDTTSSTHRRPPPPSETPSNKAAVGSRFESKPFSDALQVLSSDKDFLFLSEPQNCIKNLESDKQTCPKSNTALTLKAELQKRQDSGRFACHCSSGQPGGGSRVKTLREIKRKLKHTFGSSRRKDADQLPRFRFHGCIYSGVETREPLSSTTNAKAKEKPGKKQGLIKVEKEPLVAGEAETARKKIDVSSDLVDVAATSPWRVMSSLEKDSCFSPRRESQYFSGSAQVSLISPFRQSVYLSPARASRDVAPFDGLTTGSVATTETSSSLVPTTDEEADEARITPTRNIKFHDDVHRSEDAMISSAERAAEIKLMHSIMDSISENEASFSNAADDFPSSPTLDMCDSNDNQEEYQSPVSVLDQFFAEHSNHTLKPRRLHFEEPNTASSSQDTPPKSDPCRHDQDYTISNYVRLILEASCLNWDQLSAMRLLSEHLLHPSLFDQALFLHLDTRLLFDHMNEVLLEMQRSHFLSPYWPAYAKPRICFSPLEEAVVDEIMRDAEFYLLPRTQRRTLDQLVAKDLSGPRSRPDVRPETDHIILHISDYILEESVLDVILELHS